MSKNGMETQSAIIESGSMATVVEAAVVIQAAKRRFEAAIMNVPRS